MLHDVSGTSATLEVQKPSALHALKPQSASALHLCLPVRIANRNIGFWNAGLGSITPAVRSSTGTANSDGAVSTRRAFLRVSEGSQALRHWPPFASAITWWMKPLWSATT